MLRIVYKVYLQKWADYAAVQAQCGNLSGNEFTRNLSGNSRPQSTQLAEPLCTDPGIQSGISVRELISTSKKKIAGGELRFFIAQSSAVHPYPHLQLIILASSLHYCHYWCHRGQQINTHNCVLRLSKEEQKEMRQIMLQYGAKLTHSTEWSEIVLVSRRTVYKHIQVINIGGQQIGF